MRTPLPPEKGWRTACTEEQGFGSERHNRTLDLLNGQRVAMVGDSVTRYEYIELAFYITHGQCPEERKQRGLSTIILQTAVFGKAKKPFFLKSSEVLNTVSAQRQAHETCACIEKTRHTDGPATAEEIRDFFYRDAEVGQFCCARN